MFTFPQGLMTNPPMNHDMQVMYNANVLREPVFREVIAGLDLPPGSCGLDAGCGIGLQCLLLAQAVGETGRVTGLDANLAYLETAQALASQAGLSKRIAFQPGDWNAMPFEDGEFDWAWSADAVGYAPQEPARAIRELSRFVKPGGKVIVLFWSSQALLPGYPVLEGRLNASPAGIAPFTHGARPQAHPMRMLSWLREAGLVERRVDTYVGSVFAPLDEGQRQALADLFEMRWGWGQVDFAGDDRHEYRRLCQPDSRDYIANRPDYYAFFTYSVFSGRVSS